MGGSPEYHRWEGLVFPPKIPSQFIAETIYLAVKRGKIIIGRGDFAMRERILVSEGFKLVLIPCADVVQVRLISAMHAGDSQDEERLGRFPPVNAVARQVERAFPGA